MNATRTLKRQQRQIDHVNKSMTKADIATVFSNAYARRGYVDNTVTTNDDGLVIARIKHKTRVANYKFSKTPRARTEKTIRTKPTQQ